MKFLDVLAPAPPGVGARCARKRLRRSRCERCVTRCPTGALGWRDGALTLLAERCTGCGICLFVCPADALENLAPLQRHYHDGVLLGRLRCRSPLKSCCSGIRITVSAPSRWICRSPRTGCARSASLTCDCASAANRAGSACRSARCRAGRSAVCWASRANAGACRIVLGARRAAGALCNAGSATLDTTRCLLCGACEKACATGSITFSEQALTLDPARCTGCGDCAAVCPADAVRMDAGDTGAAIRYTLYHARCAQCGEAWRAWQQGETRCPLCRRHGFGMRGG